MREYVVSGMVCMHCTAHTGFVICILITVWVFLSSAWTCDMISISFFLLCMAQRNNSNTESFSLSFVLQFFQFLFRTIAWYSLITFCSLPSRSISIACNSPLGVPFVYIAIAALWLQSAIFSFHCTSAFVHTFSNTVQTFALWIHRLSTFMFTLLDWRLSNTILLGPARILICFASITHQESTLTSSFFLHTFYHMNERHIPQFGYLKLKSLLRSFCS